MNAIALRIPRPSGSSNVQRLSVRRRQDLADRRHRLEVEQRVAVRLRARAAPAGKLPSAAIWLGTSTVLKRSRQSASSCCVAGQRARTRPPASPSRCRGCSSRRAPSMPYSCVVIHAGSRRTTARIALARRASSPGAPSRTSIARATSTRWIVSMMPGAAAGDAAVDRLRVEQVRVHPRVGPRTTRADGARRGPRSARRWSAATPRPARAPARSAASARAGARRSCRGCVIPSRWM